MTTEQAQALRDHIRSLHIFNEVDESGGSGAHGDDPETGLYDHELDHEVAISDDYFTIQINHPEGWVRRFIPRIQIYAICRRSAKKSGSERLCQTRNLS